MRRGAAVMGRHMLRLARMLVVATFFLVAIAVPLVSYEAYENYHYEKHVIAWFSAAVTVLLAIILSVREIYNHLTHYFQPRVQRYVVRILWMVPLYGVESWLSLRFVSNAILIESFREGYEAYVIYCFQMFLIAVLGDEAELVATLSLKPASRGRHLWPFRYFLKDWRMGHEFLHYCKQGTLQYVAIKGLLVVFTMLLQIEGIYDEGSFALTSGYLYISMINNFSQIWAMYCLVLFYYAAREDLLPYRPFSKFLCVKAVVFFSFWQSVGIAILAQLGWVHAGEGWSKEDVARGLQDFVICIEMFAAALAHHYAFPYTDFVRSTTGGEQPPAFFTAFLESTLPADVLRELHPRQLLARPPPSVELADREAEAGGEASRPLMMVGDAASDVEASDAEPPEDDEAETI